MSDKNKIIWMESDSIVIHNMPDDVVLWERIIRHTDGSSEIKSALYAYLEVLQQFGWEMEDLGLIAQQYVQPHYRAFEGVRSFLERGKGQ